jgi:hypothetical protein
VSAAGILAVALLAGLAGGVVMITVAGARRTDSTLTRVVGHERVPDLMINPDLGTPSEYPEAALAPLACIRVSS